MSYNIKMQDTEYTNEWFNWNEITKTDAIESHQASLIQNFNKIDIKEIDPILLLSKQKYLLTKN
jgi:hypothetical protein